MKMKKLVSAIAALAISVSAFAGMATVANAEAVILTSTASGSSTGSTITAGTEYTVTNTQYRDWGSSDGSVKFNAGGSLAVWSFDISSLENKKVTSATLTVTVNATSGNAYNGRLLGYNGAMDTLSNGAGTIAGTVSDTGSFQPLDDKANISFGSVSTATDFTANATTYTASAVEAGNDIVNFACTMNLGRTATVAPTATLTLEVLDATSAADYTINYTYGETVVSTATGNEVVGTVVNAETSVLDQDGIKYIVADGATTSLTVDSDATKNVLNVPVRMAETYTATIDAVGGVEKNIVTGTIVEGNDYAYYYPAYLQDENGNYYKADATTYGVTGTGSENVDLDVTYTLADDVVYYLEAEDTTIITNKNTNWATYNATVSNGSSVTVSKTGAYVGIEFDAPVAGKYLLEAYYASGSTRAAYLNVDDVTVVSATAASNAGGVFAAEADLTAGTHTYKVHADYSTLPAIDYFVVTLVEAAAPTIDGTVAVEATYEEGDVYEGNATALTATFEIPAQTTFEKVTVTATLGDKSASVSKTVTDDGITTVTGGTVVYGIVVNAIVTADNVTAVAE